MNMRHFFDNPAAECRAARYLPAQTKPVGDKFASIVLESRPIARLARWRSAIARVHQRVCDDA
jgi:hypothetical protein